MTKEQILQLRRTLYRLRQKKYLSKKEALLLKNVSNRLKALDQKYLNKVQQKEESLNKEGTGDDRQE